MPTTGAAVALAVIERIELENLNVIVFNGVRLINTGPLHECIDVAIDLTTAALGEAEVYYRGVKVAAFAGGLRIFPRPQGGYRGHHQPQQESEQPQPSTIRKRRGKAYADAIIERALEETSMSNSQYNVQAAARLVGCNRQTVYNCLGRMKARSAQS